MIFSQEKLNKVQELIARYPEGKSKSAMITLVVMAEGEWGWVVKAAKYYVAGFLNVKPIKIYEVATFYSMYHLKPVGKHVFGVCQTGPCMLNGSDQILDY